MTAGVKLLSFQLLWMTWRPSHVKKTCLRSNTPKGCGDLPGHPSEHRSIVLIAFIWASWSKAAHVTYVWQQLFLQFYLYELHSKKTCYKLCSQLRLWSACTSTYSEQILRCLHAAFMFQGWSIDSWTDAQADLVCWVL